MDKSIIKSLESYSGQCAARFHMPGHKGRAAINPALDVTELDSTGNLFSPDTAMLASQERAARLFGAKMTQYCCGGATLAIQTALWMVARGRSVVFDRLCHTSTLHAAMLCGITPLWAYPDVGGNLAHGLEQKLTEDVAAVFVTSPDYLGNTRDIIDIALLCRRNNIPLIVDNSHGAHLAFVDSGALHPLHAGADLVIDSLHKTLPVLTGGAAIHCSSSQFSRESVLDAMRIFASTSPSFLILSSIDAAITRLEQSGNDEHKALKECINTLKNRLAHSGYRFSQGRTDPCRITIDVPFAGGGEALYTYLSQQGIWAEYADQLGVVALPSIDNTPRDFELLAGACERYAAMTPSAELPPRSLELPKAEQAMSISQAYSLSHKKLPKSLCRGKIAARPVNAYPPGSCIIMPGEYIDGQAWQTVASDPRIDEIAVIDN